VWKEEEEEEEEEGRKEEGGRVVSVVYDVCIVYTIDV
jgi:hypothetical protein